MITVTIDQSQIERLRANFDRAPQLALSYISKATIASLLEIEKQAIDKNFQFKTPRAQRTGLLAQSFAFGRYIEPGGLRASIGPTVKYAYSVYTGHRVDRRRNRTIYFGENKYMDRIADAATPGINRQFDTAITKFIAKLTT